MSQVVCKPTRRYASTQADLIPHGSEQISNGVSFIRSEPPQVWSAHWEKKKKQTYRRLLVSPFFQHLLSNTGEAGINCAARWWSTGRVVCVPVCKGTEICILQLVRTTALPAVSSLTTIRLSAGSFSMRSLTSFQHTRTKYITHRPPDHKSRNKKQTLRRETVSPL